ncbi:LysE family translocator [Streptomyces boninensis]|uniref:LysE family translocator n=1 Tax=Streptomyces boninensis TaxID=2039455 RepID=UPI003B223FFB
MVTSLLAFLGACTLIAATPGPSTVLIIRQSLQSRRAGMAAVLGNETGVFLWGVIAACGLTALLAASEVAYDVMRYVGAAVLLWFGVQALRSARRGGAEGFAEEGATEPSPRRAYRTALLVNLANPKVGVFAMSFLPQFVPHGAPHLATTVALAAIWAAYEVAYYAVYVWGVQRLKSVLARAGVRKRLEQVCGTVLIALGLRLAADAR